MSRRDIKYLSKPCITVWHNKLKYYRNKLKLLIEKSKIDYYNKYFNTNKTTLKTYGEELKR